MDRVYYRRNVVCGNMACGLLIALRLFLVVLICLFQARHIESAEVDLKQDNVPGLKEFGGRIPGGSAEVDTKRKPRALDGEVKEGAEVSKEMSKRDIEEIIRKRNVMYRPTVVRRTTEALTSLRALLAAINNVVLAAPKPVITTPAPPPTSSTTSPTNTNATNFNGTEQPTSTALPSTSSTTSSTTSPGNTNATNVNATEQPTSTALPSTSSTTSAVSTTMVAPTTSATNTETKQRALNSPIVSTNLYSEGDGDLNLRRLEKRVIRRTARPPATTPPPPKVYTVTQITAAVQLVFNYSEVVMTNRLSQEVVTHLEKCVKEMRAINASMAAVDMTDATAVATLLFWLNYAQLSVQHSVRLLENETEISALIGPADDLIILITIGFCGLALVLTAAMCYQSYRTLKPYHRNYNIDSSAQSKPSKPAARNSSSISNLSNRQTPNYSSPARAAATTRPNPLYSSHRSVDADRSQSDDSSSKGNSYDLGSDNNRSVDPAVAAKNERNANLGRERPDSLKSDSQDSDYKDPRRNRRGNLGGPKDNEGFDGVDVIGVRSDSESVL